VAGPERCDIPEDTPEIARITLGGGELRRQGARKERRAGSRMYVPESGPFQAGGSRLACRRRVLAASGAIWGRRGGGDRGSSEQWQGRAEQAGGRHRHSSNSRNAERSNGHKRVAQDGCNVHAPGRHTDGSRRGKELRPQGTS
jgi:hypothetical protein